MRAVSIVLVSACRFGFDPIGSQAVGDDAPFDATPAVCTSAATSCAGATLRTCTAPGVAPLDEPCAWGCVATGAPHCGLVQPGAFSAELLTAPTSLPLIDLELANVWVTADGGITPETLFPPIRAPGEGEHDGIDFRIDSGVGVYRVHSLHVSGLTRLAQQAWNGAPQPVAIVASGPIVIDALIDGQNACLTDDTANPGGYLGNINIDPSGHAGLVAELGGGGGGNGGVGGAGNGMGGHAISGFVLVGGGSGGGSGTSSLHHGVGGSGGAALQLVSSTSITISSTGAINAGGCGGWIGDYTYGGGGGGAGGTIVLEAPSIQIAGKLAVNGGAGAGSDPQGAGANGQLSRTAAVGEGGTGGFAGSPNGADTPYAAAGGGGGVGRMRFETLQGNVWIDSNAMLSPNLTDVLTTTTASAAIVY